MTEQVEVASAPAGTLFAELRERLKPPPELKYNDAAHHYTFRGKKAGGVTTAAKIVAESHLIEKYTGRQILKGAAIDANIVENVAAHLDNDTIVNAAVEEAMRVAGAHRKAERGHQMHRVLELSLLGREGELLTAQQQADVRAIRNTMDAYGLEPVDGFAEFFVIYPEHRLCGQGDAILTYQGRKVLCDLKSGLNAVRYPHATCVQLALYANAPWVSAEVEVDGDRSVVTAWQRMPEDLDRKIGYVMQIEPDAEIGELYEFDIEHGWAGALLALGVREWRQALSWGDDIVKPAVQRDWAELVAAAHTRTSVRVIWNTAQNVGALTQELRDLCNTRGRSLPADT